MNFVDFFAGIGGIRLGLEQAGHKCVGFCEFDKYARTAYKAMYDTEGEWESRDVRTVRTYDIPDADLWCFGFPCQDISVAGKQKGLQEGERSGLFYEIMRLLAGRKKEDRPRWLLVENVKNLLSIGNGFDFARLLVEVGGYGYDCEWQLLNSKDFGVPQNRERVFIVCYLGNISGREVFPLRRTDGENPCELKEITQGVSDAQRIYESDGLARTLKGESGGQGGKTGLYAVRFRYTERREKSREKGRMESVEITNALTSKHCGDQTADCSNGVLVAPVLTPDREEKRQNGRRIKEPGEPSFTLTAQDRHGVAILKKERTEYGKSIRKQYEAGSVKESRHNMTQWVPRSDGISNTLTTVEKDNYVIDTGGHNDVRIRRLTPRECFRLQGFPDEYFEKAKAAGISDTQLYQQAGNGVTVNVARAIGEKLKEVEEHG